MLHRSSAPAPKRDEVLTIRVPSSLLGQLRTLASTNDDTVSRLARQALAAIVPNSAALRGSGSDAVMPPPSDRARLVELLKLRPGADDNEIVKAVAALLKAAKGGPPPTPAEETYGLRGAQLTEYRKIKDPAARARFAAACNASPAKRSAPTRPATTRESLCQYLGLNPTKAHVYGSDIRRRASAVASGHPTAAAALRTHLGLAPQCSNDQVMAIVWSLSAPPSTTPNPYLKRLAGK